MYVIVIQPKFVCFKFVASAKYLSRLITTFYQKSTINITDLININDDLHHNAKRKKVYQHRGCTKALSQMLRYLRKVHFVL